MGMKAKEIVNTFFYKALCRGNKMIKWGLNHALYAYEAKSPYDCIIKMGQYRMTNIAPLIEQDVLIIGANHDHFIDYHTVIRKLMHFRRPVTDRTHFYRQGKCGSALQCWKFKVGFRYDD